MKIKNTIPALVLGLLSYSNFSLASNQALQAPQFNNLGSFHHEISTKVPLAQHFFDQGLVLFYGFEWGESIRSFKEATRLDPHCGMCYWGLALALGNIINAPLTGHEYRDAQSAIQQALSLKPYETAAEQDYIKALSLRFQHAPKISNKVGAFSCHTSTNSQDESTPNEIISYTNAMKKVSEKYPTDYDAKALYTYTLFKQISWRFWDAHGKINPLTPIIIKMLKSIIDKDQSNIGGNHYYIHVIEQSPRPEQALDSANRLKTLVPGSEHLVHMPVHIYFLTGRYHQGTASNLQAIEAFNEYNKTCYTQGFKPEINYLYLHNYDFLRTTAIMEGRKALALSAADQMINKPFPEWLAKEPTLQWFIPIPYFAKARFGLWKELLNEPMPRSDYQYALGMWHYARGMALAHTGEIKGAEKELVSLKKIRLKGETESNLGKQGHNLLRISNEILAATISNFQKNERLTLAHLKLAEKIQYDMGYHEPPDWYLPVKEILGDAYLKWGHPNEAIVMYEQDLKQYPKNGWALYGLAQALQEQKKNSEANQAEQQFKEAWKYADIPIPINIFKN
ncbi:MAG TPA: tetratricopeptide repeat protein [Gammaproteobacteria bacterium]|nr:tetratricopeptide repeat protein [Gammaproteobacteria bacterium]